MTSSGSTCAAPLPGAAAAAQRLREQGEGGRIICVGSPTGQVGNFGQTNYAAAERPASSA